MCICKVHLSYAKRNVFKRSEMSRTRRERWWKCRRKWDGRDSLLPEKICTVGEKGFQDFLFLFTRCRLSSCESENSNNYTDFDLLTAIFFDFATSFTVDVLRCKDHAPINRKLHSPVHGRFHWWNIAALNCSFRVFFAVIKKTTKKKGNLASNILILRI